MIFWIRAFVIEQCKKAAIEVTEAIGRERELVKQQEDIKKRYEFEIKRYKENKSVTGC